MSDVTPAVIAGAITLVVAVAGITATARQQRKQFANDLKQSENRLQNDLKTQEERLRLEMRTEFMAESAIRHLLNHPEWEQRTFRTIKLKMGDAFDDQELRKLLVRSGAVCFWKTLESGEREEFWGLIERNQDRLGRPATAPAESDAD